MGLDLYFQAFDANGKECSSKINIRGREVYHFFNDYCELKHDKTPGNGQSVNILRKHWLNDLFKLGFIKSFSRGVDTEDIDLYEEEAYRIYSELSNKDMMYVRYYFTN